MFASPSMKYYGVRRGQIYRVISEGRDFKCLSVQGHPYFVPNYVFSGGFIEEDFNEEEEYEG